LRTSAARSVPASMMACCNSWSEEGALVEAAGCDAGAFDGGGDGLRFFWSCARSQPFVEEADRHKYKAVVARSRAEDGIGGILAVWSGKVAVSRQHIRTQRKSIVEKD